MLRKHKNWIKRKKKQNKLTEKLEKAEGKQNGKKKKLIEKLRKAKGKQVKNFL